MQLGALTKFENLLDTLFQSFILFFENCKSFQSLMLPKFQLLQFAFELFYILVMLCLLQVEFFGLFYELDMQVVVLVDKPRSLLPDDVDLQRKNLHFAYNIERRSRHF